VNIRVLPTAELSDSDRIALRRLFELAYDGDFTDDDFDHALGGWHAIAGDLAAPIAHAAVVARSLYVDTRELRTGYVEAVATLPTHQRTGFGSRVMSAIAGVIRDRFELGALSTGEHGFYERLGWEYWRGPSYVRAADGTMTRSADEDDAIMILSCTPSRDVDVTAAIACDERPGDSW
jgi:aminoglycoside 2'-N-acetyltransferase I